MPLQCRIQDLVHAWKPELVFFPLTATNKIRRTTTCSPSSNRWGFNSCWFCKSLFCHSFFLSTSPREVSKVAGIDLLGLFRVWTPLPSLLSLVLPLRGLTRVNLYSYRITSVLRTFPMSSCLACGEEGKRQRRLKFCGVNIRTNSPRYAEISTRFAALRT